MEALVGAISGAVRTHARLAPRIAFILALGESLVRTADFASGMIAATLVLAPGHLAMARFNF